MDFTGLDDEIHHPILAHPARNSKPDHRVHPVGSGFFAFEVAKLQERYVQTHPLDTLVSLDIRRLDSDEYGEQLVWSTCSGCELADLPNGISSPTPTQDTSFNILNTKFVSPNRQKDQKTTTHPRLTARVY